MSEHHYTRFSDPSHGWLAVPMDELHRLGIAEAITGWSYRHGDTAYLEEDFDMSLFLDAKNKLGIKVVIDEVYQQTSPVRSYPDYRPD